MELMSPVARPEQDRPAAAPVQRQEAESARPLPTGRRGHSTQVASIVGFIEQEVAEQLRREAELERMQREAEARREAERLRREEERKKAVEARKRRAALFD